MGLQLACDSEGADKGNCWKPCSESAAPCIMDINHGEVTTVQYWRKNHKNARCSFRRALRRDRGQLARSARNADDALPTTVTMKNIRSGRYLYALDGSDGKDGVGS